MMGTGENPGIIPRLCSSIFEKIEKLSSDTLAFKVEVSYLEIYNEKVRDLLDPKKSVIFIILFYYQACGTIV